MRISQTILSSVLTMAAGTLAGLVIGFLTHPVPPGGSPPPGAPPPGGGAGVLVRIDPTADDPATCFVTGMDVRERVYVFTFRREEDARDAFAAARDAATVEHRRITGWQP